jgi:hypothetical protein
MRRHVLAIMRLQNLRHKVALFLDFGAGDDVRANDIVNLARQQARTVGHQAKTSRTAINVLQARALGTKKIMSFVNENPVGDSGDFSPLLKDSK